MTNRQETCKIDNCIANAYARGLCKSHYNKWYRYGDPLWKKERVIEKCIINDCSNDKRASNGMCGAHYQKYKKYGDPLYKSDRYYDTNICKIDGCSRPRKTLGWCEPHYCQNRRTGDPETVVIKGYDNQIVDDLLEGRMIKRLDDYRGASEPIRFQCEIDQHIWTTSPRSIFQGSGCRRCAIGKNEGIVFDVLFETNTVFIHQQKLKELDKLAPNYKADFYLPNHNIIIEYNGHQHYQPVKFNGISQKKADANFEKQKIRDNQFKQWCLSNNITLIVIDGRKYINDKLRKYTEELLISIDNENSLKKKD